MSETYPRSMDQLASWAAEHRVTAEEARQRFIQFVALSGIASVPALRAGIVFKGGNALDFVWQPNRSTLDLDFSVDMEQAQFSLSVDSLRTLLDRAFAIAGNRFGVAFAIHSVRQQPPGADKTFVTYQAKVGYGLPDESHLLIRMRNGQTSPHILPIEISINEPIGDSTTFTLDGNSASLRVSTIEDIGGEKLRSLLQQPIRNRHRRQDVLDIAVIVESRPTLGIEQVATYLLMKAAARSVPVSKAAFRNPDVKSRAQVDYAALEITTRTLFIPFEEAFAKVLDLVEQLDIPEQ